MSRGLDKSFSGLASDPWEKRSNNVMPACGTLINISSKPLRGLACADRRPTRLHGFSP